MLDVSAFSSIVTDQAKSPLLAHATKGTYPNSDGAVGITLSERFPLSICEVAAWPDQAAVARAALPKDVIAFEFAPARWAVVSERAGIAVKLSDKIGDKGSVIDLSHGRTVLRLRGQECVWVLSKLFAIDFEKMETKSGIATAHHGITAQIWREDESTFDVIIFRSFAASFWHTLTKACAEVGYEVK
ncbi:MAG: sarcosine oxidase subunit gamma family protein [Pseudomonadota bacterium]